MIPPPRTGLRSLFVLCFCLGLFLPVSGQEVIVMSNILRPTSTARTVIYVQDSLTKEALVGATVRIVSGKDTLAYATVKNMVFTVTSARCECFRRFRHPVELTVSYVGYKPFSKRYEAKDFVGNIDVDLAEDERQFQLLWKNYFRALAIPQRTNERLQRRLMPRRYWKHLTEME